MAAALFNKKIEKTGNGFSPKSRQQSVEFLDDLRKTAKELPLDYIQKHGMVTFFGFHGKKEKLGNLHPSLIKNYELAEETGYEVSRSGTRPKICTGGGPGIMTAALDGARQYSEESALGIQTYFLSAKEGSANGQRLRVHTIQARKMLMMADSSALIFFPGGLGTLDELFEALTLKKLGQMDMNVPIVLMGNKEYWEGLLSWKGKEDGVTAWLDMIADAGMIDKRYWDRMHVYFAENPKQVQNILANGRIRPMRLNFERLAKQFEKEMEQVSNILTQVQGTFVGFFGSAERKMEHSDYADTARELAREVGFLNARIYCDGSSGIGKAVREGAESGGVKVFGNRPTKWRTFIQEYFQGLQAVQNLALAPNRNYNSPVELMCSRKTVMADTKALVFFPGGFGTLNELFEYAVRMQIGDMTKRPLILTHPEFWELGVKWMEKGPVAHGIVACEELEIFKLATDNVEALNLTKDSLKAPKRFQHGP